MLDLVLTSESDRVGTVAVLPPLPGCDHCPITCSYIFDFSATLEQSPSPRRQWHNGNYRDMSCLEEIDWDLELSYLNCQAAYTHFLELLTPIIEAHVPVADETKACAPPWKVHPPTSLIKGERGHGKM